MSLRLLVAASCFVTLVACSDDNVFTPPADAGTDATTDPAEDADIDGTADVSRDPGTDPTDGTLDDAGEDAVDADDVDDTANDATEDTPADGSGDGGDVENVPPPDFVIDATIELEVPEFPALEDGEDPRPVARVVDADGRGAEFVANELIVATHDDDELAGFVERWSATVLATVEPWDGAPDDLPTFTLLRIDASDATEAELAADLAALGAEGTGTIAVSSEQGLQTICAAAAEGADGATVGLNWIGRGARFLDDRSIEAPTGVGIDGYTSNVFDWPFMASGTTQDFGVPEAWRAMELAGRLDNGVRVAILDMGFSFGGDLGEGAALSNVPFVFDIDGQSNLLGCSGGSGCPWHGTSVAAAAFGRADDSNGTAGPAGPIAEPVYVFTLYDFFTSIGAITLSAGAGARVVNMSYSADVPSILGFTVWPFELTTRIAHESGTLVFASAGNDGKNVDGEDCFLRICWEHTWHTPCENDGVICVGGLGWNSLDRAENSNFGSEHVDIFGPYTVWTGPDPRNPDNEARWINGTSFSSPFVAGAAALIWAADPSQSRADVERRLFDWAREDSPDEDVELYLHVLGPVMDAIGGPVAPYLEITAPADGTAHGAGLPGVSFAAIAEDLEDGPLSPTWTSSVDGEIGTGTSLVVSDLSPGPHTITAAAVDSDGDRTERTVDITIDNDAPTVTIEFPDDASHFIVGETFAFVGTSFDPNEPGFELTDGQMAWSSSRDGAMGTGHRLEYSSLSLGSHTVTLRGTDSGGLAGTDSITVVIDPEPVDNPPTVSISSPADDSEFTWDGYDAEAGWWYYDITLTGTATDDEDGTLSGSSLVWTTDATDHQPAVLGTGATLSTRLYGECFGTTHNIRLTATDSGGNERSATISVLVWTLC